MVPARSAASIGLMMSWQNGNAISTGKDSRGEEDRGWTFDWDQEVHVDAHYSYYAPGSL